MFDKASGWVSTSGQDTGGVDRSRRLDAGKPQTARMYDYYLGGKDHFTVDAKAAEEVLATAPNVRQVARANRHFLHLAVEYLALDRGVDQFLDIGTGIPTQPNTHQIVQYHRPEARVLYTDHDPVVLNNAQVLMTSTPTGRVDYIEADLRRPRDILQHPCLAGPSPVFDLDRPVAVCLVAILHFVQDHDRPADLIRTLMEPLASGSFLVLSHVTEDFDDDLAAAAEVYRSRRMSVRLRSAAEIQEVLEDQDLELVEPGMQPVNRWWPRRPAHLAPIPPWTDAEASCYGLIARKP